MSKQTGKNASSEFRTVGGINHPSDDSTPSQADTRMTKSIIEIADPLGIAGRDHIIAGRKAHASMKGLRLI